MNPDNNVRLAEVENDIAELRRIGVVERREDQNNLLVALIAERARLTGKIEFLLLSISPAPISRHLFSIVHSYKFMI